MSAPKVELTQPERFILLQALEAYRGKLDEMAATLPAFAPILEEYKIATRVVTNKLEIFDEQDHIIITTIAPQVQGS